MKIAVIGFAGFAMIHGCGDGRNECEIGEEHLYACLNSPDGPNSPPDIPICEGTSICGANCISSASCEALRDFYSGMPTGLSKELSDCLDACTASK